MKIFYLLLIIIVCSNKLYAKSLFETDYFEIQFLSNNIESDKIKKITEHKFYSFKNLLNKILIKDDFNNFTKIINEDLINIFIKNIIIENEKIIGNNYYSKIKINYDKKLIINYLRENKIPYVEFLPTNILTIIHEENKLYRNLFSINNSHYKFLLKNNINNNFFKLPNLDINDRYILKITDLENKNFEKINTFIEKYNNLDTVIIKVKNDNNQIKYQSYLYSNNKLINLKDKVYQVSNYNDYFHITHKEILNSWKIQNAIQNKNLNKLFCKINYYNLKELKEIKNNIENVSIIKNIKLKKISYKVNNYDIYFFGNKKILSELFKINNLNLKITNNKCKIILK